MSRAAYLFAVTGLVVCMLVPGALAEVNQAPFFTSTPPTEAQVGVPYLYDANATDPENDVLTYYILPSQKVDDMAVDPTNGVMQWTPRNAGVQLVTMYVTDGLNTVTQTFNITVAPPSNRPPRFTSDPVRTATVGQLYTYQARAVDPDGDQVYYRLDPLMPQVGISINGSSGLVTWLPADQYANQSIYVNIIAMDINELANYQPYYIEVKKPAVVVNNPPGVNGTPVINAIVGELYSYKVNGTDLDGDALAYALVMGPAGMKVNMTTGLISWTPTRDDVGTIPIKVNISDGKDTYGYVFTVSVKVREIPNHFFTDPAAPSSSPDVMCLFLPAIALLIQFALVLNGTRKRAAAAGRPRNPPSTDRP